MDPLKIEYARARFNKLLDNNIIIFTREKYKMVNKIKAIEIKDYIGKKFYTKWYQVTQEAINKFADLTKDHQYIHINPERAEDSIYGKTDARFLYPTRRR